MAASSGDESSAAATTAAHAAAHDGYHFRGKFERGTFETDTAGSDVKAEAKVDVDYVAGFVDHDVSVVTVLELQEVGDDGVGSHALDEVGACFLESSGFFASVFGDEVIV